MEPVRGEAVPETKRCLNNSPGELKCTLLSLKRCRLSSFTLSTVEKGLRRLLLCWMGGVEVFENVDATGRDVFKLGEAVEDFLTGPFRSLKVFFGSAKLTFSAIPIIQINLP